MFTGFESLSVHDCDIERRIPTKDFIIYDFKWITVAAVTWEKEDALKEVRIFPAVQ